MPKIPSRRFMAKMLEKRYNKSRNASRIFGPNAPNHPNTPRFAPKSRYTRRVLSMKSKPHGKTRRANRR